MARALNKKYFGFTILLLTVTLLLISTLFILFAAQYSALQQKITSNLYGNQQAFEAAQAGVEAAIPYFEANYAAITASLTGGFLNPYLNSNTQNVKLANNSQYSFVFSNTTANNFQLITITSTGTNADGTASRTITQKIDAYSTGAVPPVSLATQGKVSARNSATVTNTQTNANINSGSTVSFSNNAASITSAGISSNASGLGNDVTQNNATIADLSSNNFFESVLGVSTTTLQNEANYSYTNVNNTSYNSLNGVKGAIIWINQLSNTAIINSTTIIGSTTQPVILVVNGNLSLANFATIYGLVFILDPSTHTTITNSATIYGALASTKAIQLNTNAALNYDASILYILPATGAAPNYAKVPGSWKDF